MSSFVPSVAYLSPPGTYSHQAASDAFSKTPCKLIPCETISGLFGSLTKSSADYAVIPIENSTFGPVIETYNNFRTLDGSTIQIQAQIVFTISHCLLAKAGSDLPNITRVFSHEQALGQCRNFISTRLSPTVQQINTSSTAAAAEMLLPLDLNCAAICSKVCLQIYPELSLFGEGIQDTQTNVTRFIIAARKAPSSEPLVNFPVSSNQVRALVSLQPDSTDDGIGAILHDFLCDGPSNPLTLVSITRRPSLNSTLFLDNYFLEFQCLGLIESCEKIVRAHIDQLPQEKCKAFLLGVWTA